MDYFTNDIPSSCLYNFRKAYFALKEVLLNTQKAIDLFMNQCEARLAPDSVRWYRGILNAFCAYSRILPMESITLDKYLATLVCGDERKAGYYRALHAMYRFLRRRHLIKVNPMEEMDPPSRKRKLPRPITADQLDQLLRYPHAPKVKTCLQFLADSGCRPGELQKLDINDFRETPDGWVVFVTGKRGDRFVPISTQTYHAIRKELPLKWTRYQLRINIKKAFVAAHIPGSAITLRHTFATLWEGDELVLQAIMGHSNLETTKIYRQLRTARLSQQHNQYSPLRLISQRSFNII